MPEQTKQFEAYSGTEIAVGAIALPGALYAGSRVFEDLTHYPATNTNLPGPTAHDWHPTTLETGAVGVGLPLLATLALVAITSQTRRFIHNHR
jgi:hypothetical protein